MDARPPENPYAPPEAPVGEPPPVASRNAPRALRATRLRHLDDEALVRSVALYFRLLLIGLPPALFWWLDRFLKRGLSPSELGTNLALLAALFTVSFTCSVLATGLSDMRPWARWATLLTTVLAMTVVGVMLPETVRAGNAASSFGLILGLVPLALVLYVLGSRDGAFLFSSRYKEAVAATPDVKPRTSKLVPLAFLVTALWAFLATRWNGAP